MARGHLPPRSTRRAPAHENDSRVASRRVKRLANVAATKATRFSARKMALLLNVLLASASAIPAASTTSSRTKRMIAGW